MQVPLRNQEPVWLLSSPHFGGVRLRGRRCQLSAATGRLVARQMIPDTLRDFHIRWNCTLSNRFGHNSCVGLIPVAWSPVGPSPLAQYRCRSTRCLTTIPGFVAPRSTYCLYFRGSESLGVGFLILPSFNPSHDYMDVIFGAFHSKRRKKSFAADQICRRPCSNRPKQLCTSICEALHSLWRRKGQSPLQRP